MPPTTFPAREQLSLCMIVRDEARSLARCLSSAAPYVGEIVVVDTGSTDDTVAIAESYGARVLHMAWSDDFAAARNRALDAATRPWALVLDADETIVVEDPGSLLEALGRPSVAGFNLRMRNVEDAGGYSEAVLFRLFRRDWAQMRYRGVIHEQIAAVADRQVTVGGTLPGLYLTHDGYTRAVVANKDKAARNVALSRKLVAERPNDPFSWYVLGISLGSDAATEALQAYERALSMLAQQASQGQGEPYVLHLFRNLIILHLKQGHQAQARKLADEGLVRFPAAPDLGFLRGQIRLMTGDAAGAAVDLAACLTPEAAASPLIADPGAVSHGARTALAAAWIDLGRYDEAEALLEQVVASAPQGFVAPHAMLGKLWLQRGDWARALPLLQTVMAATPTDDEARFHLGWCLAKLERHQEAIETLAPLSGRPDVQHLLGKVHLEAGHGEEALKLLAACALPAAGLARGWALYLNGQARKAAECWEEWLRAGAADWGTKDTLAMFLFLLQGGKRPSGQPERPAEPLRDMDQWFRLLVRYQRFDDVEGAIQRGPQLGDRLWHPLRKRWAISLAKEGYYDVGLMLLLETREVEPGDPEIYYWLGYCALHRQSVDDARVMWETCLHLAPDHVLASQGLSLLRT